MEHEYLNSSVFTEKINLFNKYLQDDNIIEILVNKPEEIVTENKKGNYNYIVDKKITKEGITTLLTILAHYNGLYFRTENPTLSIDTIYYINKTPTLIRISGIYDTYTENKVALSIRKKNNTIFNIDMFFSKKKTIKTIEEKPIKKNKKKIIEILGDIIEKKESILIAGGTSTGKTSLLNSIIKNLIPKNLRILTIEDTRELIVTSHQNNLQIINRDSRNIAKYLELLNITIRMRPDWIIPGEIKDKMASIYINIAGTGHPSISTIHSDSPQGAISRLANLMQLEGATSQMTDLENYITKNIQYILQLKRAKNREITSKIYKLNIINKKTKITEIKL